MTTARSRRLATMLVAGTIGAGGVLAGPPASAAAAPAPIPVPADYDGDGRQDAAEWRPADGTWVITPAAGGPTVTRQLGQSGDLPVPGDYQDDAKIELAVVRPGGVLRAQAVAGGAVQNHPWATLEYRPKDADVPRMLNLAGSANGLSSRLHVAGRFAEAAEALKVARDVYRKLAEHQPVHRESWGRAALALGSNLVLSGQSAEGIIASYEGVEVFHDLGDPVKLAGAYEALAGAFHQAGRYSEAVTPARKAYDIYLRLDRKEDQIRAAISLSGNLSLSARHDEAIDFGNRAVNVAKAIGNQQKLAEAYYHLSVRYHQAKRFAEAARASEQSVVLYRTLVTGNPALRGDLVRALLQWGGNLALTGDRTAAVNVTKEAVEVARQVGDRAPLASAYDQLVPRLREAGRTAEALDPAQQARLLYRDLLPVNRTQYLPGWSNATLALAQTLADLGRRAEAKVHAQESVAGYQELVDANPGNEFYKARLEIAKQLLNSL